MRARRCGNRAQSRARTGSHAVRPPVAGVVDASDLLPVRCQPHRHMLPVAAHNVQVEVGPNASSFVEAVSGGNAPQVSAECCSHVLDRRSYEVISRQQAG